MCHAAVLMPLWWLGLDEVYWSRVYVQVATVPRSGKNVGQSQDLLMRDKQHVGLH